MLTAEKLHELTIKGQTTELNVRREYAQHLFLAYFYQEPQAAKIFFKGGTALRLIYNSPRFSEDLDFSAVKTTSSQIENIIQNTLTAIEREGIKTEISEAKKTTGGYLTVVEFKFDQEKIAIRIEISFRDKNARGEVVTIAGDFIPAYTVVGLTKEQLIQQKINALLTRNKPRDFYDFYFILRANLMPDKQTDVFQQVLATLKKSRISFAMELEQFLPKSHWLIIKDFKSALESEIEKFL
jgi:predicted nucleotidyltransferase component of viral defense system